MKKLFCTILLFAVGAAAAMAQTWAVAVNAADAIDLGTIGIEGSAAVGQHWSIHAGAKVNPWTFNKHNTWNGLFSEPDPDQKQDRKQVYAVGARWWPWNVYSGWWVPQCSVSLATSASSTIRTHYGTRTCVGISVSC